MGRDKAGGGGRLVISEMALMTLGTCEIRSVVEMGQPEHVQDPPLARYRPIICSRPSPYYRCSTPVALLLSLATTTALFSWD